MAVITQIQFRRGTASQWSSTNPVLSSGELGYETDTGNFKIGNGSTAWNSLSVLNGITASTTATFTNKTINLSSNTLTGTIAQFNTALSDGDFATLAGSETLTNKTLTAPRFANAGFIADSNGNELLEFTATASAVNQITLANSAAGSAPSLSATGSDTNISLNLVAKGTGTVQAGGVPVVTTTESQTLTNKTLTSPVISSISNTGTLTLPTSTDTLVGRATTDTLTNKSIDLTNNTLTATSAQLRTAVSDETGTGSLVFAGAPTLTGTVTFSGDITLSATNAFGSQNDYNTLNLMGCL